MENPLLAITMGDPAGIGPETIVGAWENPTLHEAARAVVVGHPEVLRRAVRLLESSLEVVEVSTPEEADNLPQTICCLPCGSDEAAQVKPATVDPRGGQAAYDALALATELALGGRVDGITTAPLNKAALRAAGHHHPGHTEILAELCGVEEAGMMLYLSSGGAVRGRVGLGVVHATLHMALRSVFDHLTLTGIAAKAHLADRIVRCLLGEEARENPPRIGVCALNPHAGEEGLFGDEERLVIAEAVRQGRADGLTLEGPLPADTLLASAVEGNYDAVVAMYHDQGHIALKLLGMHRAVNITLGLPIIRTSVAHGTAFDLAWQGKAKSHGMIEAIRTAALLAGRKEQFIARRDVATS